MAHTARSPDEVPGPPLARPNAGLVAWAVFGALIVAFLVYGFTRSRPPSLHITTPGITLDGTPGSIRTYGSIPELLDGNTSSKVTLRELPSGPGVVAVGSLSGLRGEMAIVHGVTWISSAAPGDRIHVERDPTEPEGVAFLALANVAHFRKQKLDTPVPFERLADFIEERARQADLDLTRPFPLMIDGNFSAIELDVANGPALGAQKPTQERLQATAIKVSLPSGHGSIVGFYALSGGERLLHAGKRMHLHIVLPAAREVGHLDSARIEAGSVLSLPAKD